MWTLDVFNKKLKSTVGNPEEQNLRVNEWVRKIKILQQKRENVKNAFTVIFK
jgi:hypothetical protein